MKRLMILCLMIGGLFALQAQTTKATPYKGTGAEIQFDKLTVDFGTLKVGDVKTVTITFTNIGKKPLILDDVISSCDCTTVDWSKQPIMPGKKGTIKATYTAKHTGLISKRLTVLSNANTDRVILQLKGEVK
ncbi:MAG: DUF1573 domain-containing protein [Bacteroidales bacterium]|nr:DUF1573 domain-containing protein [Bacteroidales bacterium]MBR0304252.1 DUF1573 domain-containing protein [Bacteroidales bacterium]